MDKRRPPCYTKRHVSPESSSEGMFLHMKKHVCLPLAALAGGGAAFALRLLQNRTGFEADTGLPVPGDPYRCALIALLLALAVLFLLLVRRLPEDRSPAFPASFATASPALLTLPVAGVFLMGASGALEIVFGFLGSRTSALTGSGMVVLWQGGSPVTALLLGLLSLASAVCLFPAAAACRRREGAAEKPFSSALLLVPTVCLVVRLVMAYRVDSVDPSLSAYYVELLALAFLTLGFYRLSSFAFQAGQTRRFALYALPAVTLSIATLADGHGLTGSLLYAGGALVLLGFLLLRLGNMDIPRDSL